MPDLAKIPNPLDKYIPVVIVSYSAQYDRNFMSPSLWKS